MVDYAPGMRTIIRDEEWMVKKVEKNNMGNLDLLWAYAGKQKFYIK